jgi:hypothetical protein
MTAKPTRVFLAFPGALALLFKDAGIPARILSSPQ